MRAAFSVTIVLLLFFVGAFYYVFYTPALVIKAAPAIAERYLKDVQIQSLQIGGQVLEYPNTLRLFRIKGELTWGGETYHFDIKEINLPHLLNTVKEKRNAKLNIDGLNLQKKNLEIKNAGINVAMTLDENSIRTYEGFLQAGEIHLTPYQFNNIQMRFQGSKEALQLTEIKTEAYGGQAKGEIKLIFVPKLIQMVLLEFNGIKTAPLQNFNKALFNQIDSELNGTLRLNKSDEQIQILALLVNMPKGATLSADMINRIVSTMTDEDKRYNIQAILENNRTITFDKAEFRILNVNQNLASITFTLDNKQQNLHIQETVNVDMSRILQKIAWKY